MTGPRSDRDGLAGLEVREHEDGVSFAVRVRPGAARDAVDGVREGALQIRLTAPPVEGAANASLIKHLARILRVPKRAVTIVQGERSRNKTVGVTGVDGAALRRAFEGGKAQQLTKTFV